MIKTLNTLKKGEKGIIHSFKGRSEIKKHLVEMGLCRGSEVEVQRVAPLGDPIEVQIKGYSLSLRKDEAKNIEVELE